MLLTRDLVRGPIRGLVVPAAVLDDVTPGAGLDAGGDPAHGAPLGVLHRPIGFVRPPCLQPCGASSHKLPLGIRGAYWAGTQRLRHSPPRCQQVEVEAHRHPISLRHPVFLPPEVAVKVAPERSLGGVQRFHPFRHGRAARNWVGVPIGLALGQRLEIRVVVVVVAVPLDAAVHCPESKELGHLDSVPRHATAIVGRARAEPEHHMRHGRGGVGRRRRRSQRRGRRRRRRCRRCRQKVWEVFRRFLLHLDGVAPPVAQVIHPLHHVAFLQQHVADEHLAVIHQGTPHVPHLLTGVQRGGLHRAHPHLIAEYRRGVQRTRVHMRAVLLFRLRRKEHRRSAAEGIGVVVLRPPHRRAQHLLRKLFHGEVSGDPDPTPHAVGGAVKARLSGGSGGAAGAAQPVDMHAYHNVRDALGFARRRVFSKRREGVGGARLVPELEKVLEAVPLPFRVKGVLHEVLTGVHHPRRPAPVDDATWASGDPVIAAACALTQALSRALQHRHALRADWAPIHVHRASVPTLLHRLGHILPGLHDRVHAHLWLTLDLRGHLLLLRHLRHQGANFGNRNPRQKPQPLRFYGHDFCPIVHRHHVSPLLGVPGAHAPVLAVERGGRLQTEYLDPATEERPAVAEPYEFPALANALGAGTRGRHGSGVGPRPEVALRSAHGKAKGGRAIVDFRHRQHVRCLGVHVPCPPAPQAVNLARRQRLDNTRRPHRSRGRCKVCTPG
mmetsp:Transcript_31340/g.78598  ORF Transcript_31340/g.78598 Transcript_31340/m.78598 type:complete len:723 (-) Transcript_31340:799-2967(-)